jgi:hyperosmotically inducible protein
MKVALTFLIALAVLSSPTGGTLQAAQHKQDEYKPRLSSPSKRKHGRTAVSIGEDVRRHLVTLPYYGVFDWLEAEVLPGDTVVLRGYVTRPSTKSDAEARVRRLESVANVVNEIEVLPLSTSDDRIRLAMYRAVFNFNSPLFQYATRAVPPIHIVVKNGRATLKGVVLNDSDRQLAYTAARNVSGVFELKNELAVENL